MHADTGVHMRGRRIPRLEFRRLFTLQVGTQVGSSSREGTALGVGEEGPVRKSEVSWFFLLLLLFFVCFFY